MSDTLLLFIDRQPVVIDRNGVVRENDIIGKVSHFLVERYDTYRYVKNEKVYTDLKGAFKALATKAQKYPNTAFEIRMFYFDKRTNNNGSTKLFEMKVKSNGIAKILYSYNRFFLCEIDTSDYSIDYNDGDENYDNSILSDWFPKKRNRKMTALQEKIASFKKFNVQNIDFKGIVPDKEKDIFFSELEHCFQNINEVFPVNDFFPVKEIYFSKYKKAYGKYGQHKISLNPQSVKWIRDTIYHEYGHFLYDLGLFGASTFLSTGMVDRDSAISIADELLNHLSEERTLTEIKERAMTRMRGKGKEPNVMEIEKYRSEHEKYLLRDTEIFARFFEAFMIYRDKKRNKREIPVGL